MFISKYSYLRDKLQDRVEYEKNKYPLTEREQTFISIIDELLRYLHDDAKKRELNKFDWARSTWDS